MPVLSLPAHLLKEGWMCSSLLPEVEQWCTENCQGEWHTSNREAPPTGLTNAPQAYAINGEMYSISTEIRVYEPAIEFENKNDALHFKMRWF